MEIQDPCQFSYLNKCFHHKWRQEWVYYNFSLKISKASIQKSQHISLWVESVLRWIYLSYWGVFRKLCFKCWTALFTQVSQLENVLCVLGWAMVLVQCTTSGETMCCHGPGHPIPQPSPYEASLVSLSWINQWKANMWIRFSEEV